jgi:zinc transport system permease protein
MYLTPGYNADLMTYLFGNILIVSGQEIYLLVGLNLLIAIVVIFFFRQLLAVSFDEEYAALRGIPAALLYILLLCLIALAIVVLMRLVGLILVIALLTLPPAIALLFTKRIFQVMGLAIIIGALFTLTGLWLAYKPDLPAGAMIVLVTGAGYVIAVIIKKGAALLRVFNK